MPLAEDPEEAMETAAIAAAKSVRLHSLTELDSTVYPTAGTGCPGASESAHEADAENTSDTATAERKDRERTQVAENNIIASRSRPEEIPGMVNQ